MYLLLKEKEKEGGEERKEKERKGKERKERGGKNHKNIFLFEVFAGIRDKVEQSNVGLGEKISPFLRFDSVLGLK